MISNVVNITNTALQNASKTLEVSATNVANIQSKGQVGDVQENGKPYVARRVESTSLVEGGVKTQVKDKAPNVGVNLEEEIVTQQFASYQVDASLKTLKAVDETTGNLLDIIA